MNSRYRLSHQLVSLLVDFILFFFHSIDLLVFLGRTLSVQKFRHMFATEKIKIVPNELTCRKMNENANNNNKYGTRPDSRTQHHFGTCDFCF